MPYTPAPPGDTVTFFCLRSLQVCKIQQSCSRSKLFKCCTNYDWNSNRNPVHIPLRLSRDWEVIAYSCKFVLYEAFGSCIIRRLGNLHAVTCQKRAYTCIESFSVGIWISNLPVQNSFQMQHFLNFVFTFYFYPLCFPDKWFKSSSSARHAAPWRLQSQHQN